MPVKMNRALGYRSVGSPNAANLNKVLQTPRGLARAPKTVAQAGGQEMATPKSDTQKKYKLVSEGGGTYKVAGGETLNVATAGAQAFLRLGSAAFVSGRLSPSWKRPQKPIELYEFEGCPFCRKVREAASILDIDVLFYPCPSGGPTWRPKAIKESGKSQFPYMKDPNNGKNLLESDAIVKYLFDEYGDGTVPALLNAGPLTTITAGIALLPRLGKGSRYKPSNLPEKPLEIWGYESSPFVKLSREVLSELEIPHIYHTVARNSPKRKDMEAKWGSFQVPYLEDPNTMEALFESSKINSYLLEKYAR